MSAESIACPAATFMMALAFASAAEEQLTVVPRAEREIGQSLGVQGPTETIGVEASTLLGAIALDDEFTDIRGRVLRAREITLAPGGVAAVDQHESRPGVRTASKASSSRRAMMWLNR